jgi:Flp pilus assembly protein TadG
MLLIRKAILRKFQQHDGACILETALLMPVMFLMIVGAVDFGRAYYTAIEVASAAHAGALYGVENPTDTSGMATAANVDAPDLSSLKTVGNYGYVCSDESATVASSGSAPACTYNYVTYVSVTATAIYTPLITYPGIPSSLTLTSTTRLRAGGD